MSSETTDHHRRPGDKSRASFPVTQWGAVLAAGDGGSPAADAAFGSLCQAYWFPIYACARRRGYDPVDAEDLTQGFFYDLLKRRSLQRVSAGESLFRTWLQRCFENFVNNEWRRNQAEKRGGNRVVSLDLLETEGRYIAEAAAETPPPDADDLSWAKSILYRVSSQLEAEYYADGRTGVFVFWRSRQAQQAGETGYAQAARALGLTPGTLRTAISRLRTQLGARFRDAIAATVNLPEDVDDEVRYLMGLLFADGTGEAVELIAQTNSRRPGTGTRS